MEKNTIETLNKIADRERSPMYTVGDVTGDDRFTFQSKTKGNKPMDLAIEDMFGSSPKTVMTDKTVKRNYSNVAYNSDNFNDLFRASTSTRSCSL